jgi:hypothetical protein
MEDRHGLAELQVVQQCESAKVREWNAAGRPATHSAGRTGGESTAGRSAMNSPSPALFAGEGRGGGRLPRAGFDEAHDSSFDVYTLIATPELSMSCEERASACYSPQRLVDNSAGRSIFFRHAPPRHESDTHSLSTNRERSSGAAVCFGPGRILWMLTRWPRSRL